jgi:hypothetical protein
MGSAMAVTAPEPSYRDPGKEPGNAAFGLAIAGWSRDGGHEPEGGAAEEVIDMPPWGRDSRSVDPKMAGYPDKAARALC